MNTNELVMSSAREQWTHQTVHRKLSYNCRDGSRSARQRVNFSHTTMIDAKFRGFPVSSALNMCHWSSLIANGLITGCSMTSVWLDLSASELFIKSRLFYHTTPAFGVPVRGDPVCISLTLLVSQRAVEGPFCVLQLLHFCQLLSNYSIDLELEYIFEKPMKHRFQQYIVRMEILSTFHARVEYISVTKYAIETIGPMGTNDPKIHPFCLGPSHSPYEATGQPLYALPHS